MQVIYQAVGHFSYPGIGSCEHTVVASFKARADAAAFCKEANDEVQCDMMEVEEIWCVDNYGFPVCRKEYAELHPNLLESVEERHAAKLAKEAAFRAYCKEMGANS